MSRRVLHLLLGLLLTLSCMLGVARQNDDPGRGRGNDAVANVTLDELPVEARHTLHLIDQGGPFPYPRDGIVFGNYERRLPGRSRGYYREYTVPTPGLRSRGARRIIAGDRGERFYTGDHYQTFQRVRE